MTRKEFLSRLQAIEQALTELREDCKDMESSFFSDNGIGIMMWILYPNDDLEKLNVTTIMVGSEPSIAGMIGMNLSHNSHVREVIAIGQMMAARMQHDGVKGERI